MTTTIDRRQKTKAQLIAELDQTRELLEKLKQTEEELRESEEQFRNVAEQSPNMIFVNQRGKLVYVNRKCEEIMGYTKEEFYSLDFDFLCLIAPESLELIKEKFQEHMKGHDIPPYEYTVITKDGQRIESINESKLISFKGEAAILGIVTDITDRKRMEETLKESEEMYRSLIERANDGVAIIQDDSVITFVNTRITEMIGYEEHELIGKQFGQFVPVEQIQELTKRYKKRMAGESFPAIYEISLLKKGGEKIDVEINAGIIQHQGKAADLAFVRDITERKRSEEALAESEHRYRELVEAASDVIFTTDPKGYFTYANPPTQHLTGYTKEELIGMHFTELVAPEWRERVQS
ncbi:MAG: PAS domain S-box protein, partial [Fidelibacterota bacterium]